MYEYNNKKFKTQKRRSEKRIFFINDYILISEESLKEIKWRLAMGFKKLLTVISMFIFSAVTYGQEQKFDTDSFKLKNGTLGITFIGHGSLLLNYQKKNIYIDPFSKQADYSKLPKADLILITHEHQDHLDLKAIEAIKTNKTQFIVTQIVSKTLKTGTILKNGESKTILGIKIQAVPAYNLVHKRDNGEFFHHKGNGNGYVLTISDKKIYIAGDTENIPEMKNLKNIDIAFIPMNLPYTMTPEMAADAAKMMMPKILYPYHFGETDTAKLIELLKDEKSIEIRIRKMK